MFVLLLRLRVRVARGLGNMDDFRGLSLPIPCSGIPGRNDAARTVYKRFSRSDRDQA